MDHDVQAEEEEDEEYFSPDPGDTVADEIGDVEEPSLPVGARKHLTKVGAEVNSLPILRRMADRNAFDRSLGNIFC